MNKASESNNKINIKGIWKPEKKAAIIISIIFAIILIILEVYNYEKMNFLSNRIDILSTKILAQEVDNASTTALIQANLARTSNDLSQTIKQNVGDIESRLGSYQNQVNNITGTVATIQKLSKIDPEILQKYSKVFFLNENYAPVHLFEIPSSYTYSDTKKLRVVTETWTHLQDMLDSANNNGIKIYTFSAYRSFREQSALKSQYSVIYGAGTANSFSADQGYSEHQLGTALDFITTGLGGNLDGFDKTKAYEWLRSTAYRFGFVLSYPQNNGYYVFEPWHWRFIGVKLATMLHDTGKNFYDLDQRTIDEYLVSVFD